MRTKKADVYQCQDTDFFEVCGWNDHRMVQQQTENIVLKLLFRINRFLPVIVPAVFRLVGASKGAIASFIN